ncbi:MFS transporter [uncultured Slackia sp.]|uniref:MFS transporter n=1 Tax=uncultured Slackia sp. TaxID=665903 RepID=UPI0026DCF078|nr:MFS transporter [uncultured Slackia sp.]
MFGIIVLVVTLPFTAFIVRSKPSDKGVQAYGADEVSADAGKPAAPEVGVSADKAMKTAAFFALAGFSFLITVNQTVYQFLPSYCASFSNSVPEIAAVSGVVASACMAGQAIGKVILGAVNDKSCKGGMALGIGSGLVGVVLMWFLPSVVALLFVGAFLFGFVYACTTVQTPLLVRTTFGSRDYTNIYSRVSMAGTLGGVVASTFWAWVIDLPGGFSIMFVLSIVCMALCFLFGVFALGQGKKLEKTEN